MLRRALPFVVLVAAAAGCGSPALSEDAARRAAVGASEVALNADGARGIARHLYVTDGDVATLDGAHRVTQVVWDARSVLPAVRTDRIDGDTVVAWVPGPRLATADGDVTLPTQRFVVRARGGRVVAEPAGR